MKPIFKQNFHPRELPTINNFGQGPFRRNVFTGENLSKEFERYVDREAFVESMRRKTLTVDSKEYPFYEHYRFGHNHPNYSYGVGISDLEAGYLKQLRDNIWAAAGQEIASSKNIEECKFSNPNPSLYLHDWNNTTRNNVSDPRDYVNCVVEHEEEENRLIDGEVRVPISDDKIGRHIFSSIKRADNIQRLILENVAIRDAGFESFVDCLKATKNLQELELHYNLPPQTRSTDDFSSYVPEKHAIKIAEGLAKNKSLKRVVLDITQINSSQLGPLLNSLRINPSVNDVEIVGGKSALIQEDKKTAVPVIENLAALLHTPTKSMRKLTLKDCNIGDVEKFISIIGNECCRLTDLKLDNCVDAKGEAVSAEALEKLQKIVDLNKSISALRAGKLMVVNNQKDSEAIGDEEKKMGQSQSTSALPSIPNPSSPRPTSANQVGLSSSKSTSALPSIN